MRPQAHKKADFVFGAGKAVLEEDDGASGSVKIVFVQITWRHFKMQLSDNKYSTFLGVAWCHQIEATARANVPQRCLEQGFACAVICRNCDTDNQQHNLPPVTCALAWQKPHPAPNTRAPRPGDSLIRRRYGGGVGNQCRWADRFASV